MKKLFFIFSLLLTFVLLAGCSSAPAAQPTSATYSGGDTAACYREGVHSFSDLDEKSVCVVRASVDSTEVIVGQMSRLTVSNVYRGSAPDNIRLYQMADDNAVKEGKEYLLFMGVQIPETPDSGDYSPVGGGIGVIRIDEGSNTLYVKNGSIIDSDLVDWLNGHGFRGWNVKIG